MNVSVYVFGKLGDGYTQYPDDHTKDFFLELQQQMQAHTQLAIHRDGDLMYYAYTRKLSESCSHDQYIGICCVFNGAYTDKYKKIFEICEDAVTSLVVHGDLLEFTCDGDITSKVDKLYKAESAFKAFSEYLSLQIDTVIPSPKKLPPVNYAISTSEIKKMSVNDKVADISDAIRNYSTIIIAKEKGYNTASLSSYAGKLHDLHENNKTLKQENEKLESSIVTLKRQQKRIGWVLFLTLVILFGGVVFGIVLQNKDYELRSSNAQVFAVNNENEKLQRDLNTNKNTLDSTANELNTAKRNLAVKTDSLQNAVKTINKQKETISKQDESIRKYKKDLAEKDKIIRDRNQTINRKDQTIRDKDQTIRNLTTKGQEHLSVVSKKPLIITEMQVANVYGDGTIETEYGKKINHRNTMYLKPRIKYKGMIPGYYTIYMRLYDPSGTLSTGTSSPEGYTSSIYIYVGSGVSTANFDGWGNKTKGNWPAGEYRCEFYCNGGCVGVHSFVIY